MTVNDNIPAAPRPASRRRGEAGGAMGLHPPPSAGAAAVASAVTEFVAHESKLPFGALNHALDQEINSQTAHL